MSDVQAELTLYDRFHRCMMESSDNGSSHVMMTLIADTYGGAL